MNQSIAVDITAPNNNWLYLLKTVNWIFSLILYTNSVFHLGSEVSLAGDARHDSAGHSAKFGTYTIFCCTIGLIIHLVLVQVLNNLLISLNCYDSISKTKFFSHEGKPSWK